MVYLSAIKPGWVFVQHREVNVGEIIRLLRGDGHEIGIEDRLVSVVVKEGLANIRKRRLRDRVVLLLEEESDNVAGFSRHSVGLVRNLVWRCATESDLPDLGNSKWNEDEGSRGETRDMHYVRFVWVECCQWVFWRCREVAFKGGN